MEFAGVHFPVHNLQRKESDAKGETETRSSGGGSVKCVCCFDGRSVCMVWRKRSRHVLMLQ